MKGKSIIELRDVHTGEVERHVDHNLVTNGIKTFPGIAFGGSTVLTNDSYFPLWKNWFSGLKLFENVLEEEPENYIYKYNETVTGYASNTADTSDNKRGLLNISESGILDDASGIRLVWDFAQSQANGQISCISVVPNIFVIPENIKKMYFRLMTSKKKINPLPDESSISVNYLINYDKKTRVATLAVGIDQSKGMIKFAKCVLEPAYCSVVSERTLSIIEEHDMEVPFKSYFQFYLSESNFIYLLIQNSRANENGVYTYNYSLITIDKNNYTMETKTFDVQFNENFDNLISGMSFENNGFLYVRHGTGNFKIEIVNTNNIEKIEHLGLGNIVVNGELLGNGWVVDADGIFQEKISGVPWQAYDASTPRDSVSVDAFVEILKGIYMLVGAEPDIYGLTIFADTRILYTINNLATPVIKTADKTMKITYILTNE